MRSIESQVGMAVTLEMQHKRHIRWSGVLFHSIRDCFQVWENGKVVFEHHDLDTARSFARSRGLPT